MDIIFEKKEVSKAVKTVENLIKKNKVYKNNNFTFGCGTNKGSNGTGPLRYYLLFGFRSIFGQIDLVEVNVPFFDKEGKIAPTQGRIASKGKEIFLIRSLESMTAPGRVNISKKLEAKLEAPNIVEIENKKYIIFCSISKFKVHQLINLLRIIYETKFNAHLIDLLGDIDELTNEKGLSVTEKEQLINARLGQGKFRNGLIKHWNGSCAISGFQLTDMLIASHIKPWSKCNNIERLDPYNGLLLSPNFDKLFDKGYISFKGNGKILLSKMLKGHYKMLGITESSEIKVNPRHKNYLKFHRENIFQKD
jgi:hypothetical protein